MGGVSRRLERLEDLARDRAVGELRRAWASLTDEEVALVMAPYADGIREPTPKEREMEEKVRVSMPEELIAQALGLTERMESEEIDRRIHILVGELGIFERGAGIRRHLQAASDGRR